MNFLTTIFSFISSPFKRKVKTMTLTDTAKKVLEAQAAFIAALTCLLNENKAGTCTSSKNGSVDPVDPGPPRATKKETAELKKEVKLKAGEVMKELGKKKLTDLFAKFEAGKFSELKEDNYDSFITSADETLAAKEDPGDDDLLDEPTPAPTKEEKVYTLEDVKALLLKVNNTKDLGREITRQILGDLGAARLGELKKDKFAKAVKEATRVLTNAGVEV